MTFLDENQLPFQVPPAPVFVLSRGPLSDPSRASVLSQGVELPLSEQYYILTKYSRHYVNLHFSVLYTKAPANARCVHCQATVQTEVKKKPGAKKFSLRYH